MSSAKLRTGSGVHVCSVLQDKKEHSERANLRNVEYKFSGTLGAGVREDIIEWFLTWRRCLQLGKMK